MKIKVRKNQAPACYARGKAHINRKKEAKKTGVYNRAADYTSGFIGLTGKAELFKTQHELGHQTPQQIFQDLMTD